MITVDLSMTIRGLCRLRSFISGLALLIFLSSAFLFLLASEKTEIPKEQGWEPEFVVVVVNKVEFNSSSHNDVVLQDPRGVSTTVRSPLDNLKVPYPILHVSLPKSGTTSTSRYFYCGNIWTAHTFANTIGTTHKQKQMRVGHCYLNNVQAGRPPLHDCGNYKVWSDLGHPRGTPCYYPSVHGLNEFAAAYPHATILLVTRNSTAWSQSVLKWKNGDLLRKWRRCDKFPNKKASEQDLVKFYEWHAQNIRDFVKAHPSLTYVEVSLEDEDIGDQLEAKIGVNASCFGHHNSHEKRLKLNPKFREQYLAEQARLNQTRTNQTGLKR